MYVLISMEMSCISDHTCKVASLAAAKSFQSAGAKAQFQMKCDGGFYYDVEKVLLEYANNHLIVIFLEGGRRAVLQCDCVPLKWVKY